VRNYHIDDVAKNKEDLEIEKELSVLED
jgi:hypothetical protein